MVLESGNACQNLAAPVLAASPAWFGPFNPLSFFLFLVFLHNMIEKSNEMQNTIARLPALPGTF
jgi:hypothetical protein